MSVRSQKRRGTNPNWNPRKALIHNGLNQKMPGRVGVNEANPEVGQVVRGASRMSPMEPSRIGPTMFTGCQKAGEFAGTGQDRNS